MVNYCPECGKEKDLSEAEPFFTVPREAYRCDRCRVVTPKGRWLIHEPFY